MNRVLRNIQRALFPWVFFILTVGAVGQTSTYDQERLNRDLRIMEGILDKLFKGKAYHRFFNGHAKAVYLPNFGIVFHMSQRGPVHHELGITLRRQFEEVHEMARSVREEHAELRQRMAEKREDMQKAFETDEDVEELEVPEADIDAVDEFVLDSDKIIEEENKAIDAFKEYIVVFFRNYSPAIGQLSPQDRIAVLINLEDWESTDSENAFLTAWVTKQDVDRYRRSRMEDDEFEKYIHFQLADSESDIDMDIGILSEIFDRAMITSSFWGEPSNSGIYLSGLGALLFIEIPSMLFANPEDENMISVLAGEEGRNAVIYTPERRRSSKRKGEKYKSEDEILTEIEDELFELAASYGHTLRIKSQESVILNVDLGNRLYPLHEEQKSPSHLILQLNKKDLDDYNRGVITLSNLKKKLIRQTY